ncbi:MAG TPA: hypothetical protein VF294_06380 [Polyangiaceae bacterium]
MRIALGLALLSAACIYACGSSSSSGKGGSAGADIGAAGDSSSTGGKGNGGAGKGNTSGGDTSSDAGSAGTGDSGAAGDTGTPIVVVSTAKPHAAGGLVAGGVVAHSKHFTGVFSLGAAPGGNRISTSANYQLRGGVLGASQK